MAQAGSWAAEPTSGSISPPPAPNQPSMLASSAFASQGPFQTVVLKAPSTSPEISPAATVVRSNPNVVYGASGHTSPTPVPSPQSGHRRVSNPRISPHRDSQPQSARKVIRHLSSSPVVEDAPGMVMYGIGLKVDTMYPHIVQHVSDLQDPNGQNINGAVKVGDVMVSVDNTEFHMGEATSVEGAVLGEFGSVARILLKSKDSGSLYTVHARRHFPIRPANIGSSLKATVREMSSYDAQDKAAVFLELQGIRNDVLAENSFMLRESTVGIGLGVRGAGNAARFVQTLILGSPAHLSGSVGQGDEITMVDGFPTGTDGSLIFQRLHGSAKIGSQCNLTLDRNGKKNAITLLHTSAEALRRTEKLLEGIDSILRGIRQGVGNQALENSTQVVWDAAIEVEVTRQQLEVKVVELLRSLQSRVISRVDRVESQLREVGSEPSMDFSQGAWSGTSSRDGSPWGPKIAREAAAPAARAAPPPPPPGDASAEESAEVASLSAQLREEQSARGRAEEARERLEAELARRDDYLQREQQSRLKTEGEVERLRADVWKIREETAGMVPRDALDDLNAVCRQYVSTIEGLRTQINSMTAMEGKAEELKAEVERLQGKLQGRDDMVQDLQSQMSRKSQDDASGPRLLRENTELRSKVSELERKLQEKDSERIAAESARQLTQKAVEGLADSKRQLSKANMDLRSSTDAEIAKMREEMLLKDDLLSEMQRKMREQEGIKAATAEACQIMRGEADNLTRTNMELLGTISALNKRVKECEYTIANRDASIEELQRIVDDVERKGQGANSAQQAQLLGQIDSLRVEIDDKEKELAEKRGECWALTETNNVLRKDMEETSTSKQALAHTNMKLIEKLEALESEMKALSAAERAGADVHARNPNVGELEALRSAAEQSSKEKERLEQTIVRERTRIKALEHEKERMKSNRDAEAERWEQRVRDLEADLVRKNAGLEDLQVKLNNALEAQEKLQEGLRKEQNANAESPEKTRKLNAVIFNMSEKVEDLKGRIKELEVERDDATEAVRMQEEQIIKLQERLSRSRSPSPAGPNGVADIRITSLEDQIRDLQERLSKAKPAAEFDSLRFSLESKHREEIARVHALYKPAQAAAASREASPSREYMALDKAHRSFPSSHVEGAPSRPARPGPTVLSTSPTRHGAFYSSLSPPRYPAPSPHTSPSKASAALGRGLAHKPSPSPNTQKRGVIGIQVESGAPYRVLKVSEMMDEHGRFVRDWVTPADELVKIDGYPVADAPVFEVFSRLGGNVGSLVELQLRSKATGRQYQIKVQRHEKPEEASRVLTPQSKDSWDSSSDDE